MFTPTSPRITLEQWQALQAVVDAGGYAQAALALHKSQSAVTYAVQKLETLLGVKAFEIQGRKAVLTPIGQLLYRRARTLLSEANDLEQAARKVSAGWETEIRVAAEVIFPTWLLLQCFARFSAESPHTRIELIESVLAGTTEALVQGQADLAIAGRIPQGFVGDPLMRLKFIAAAQAEHPLHKLGRPITARDLRNYRHLVVRETDTRRATNVRGVDAIQRWTVSHLSTSIDAACMGFGFAWYPEERIRAELERGVLKPLPLREGSERFGELYLVYADMESLGPGTRRLIEIIKASVASDCADQGVPSMRQKGNVEGQKQKKRKKGAAA